MARTPFRFAAALAAASTFACLVPVTEGDGGRDAGAGDAGPCDAGSAAGCWTVPGFADCACRCGADSARSAIPTDTVASCRGCGSCQACACGFGTADVTRGCAADNDCVLARADCCGCEMGGSATAIRKSFYDVWDAQMVTRCHGVGNDGGGCPAAYLCGSSRARCVDGGCAIVP